MAGRQRQLVLLTPVARRYNSPDGSAFEVDRRLDEVRSVRHGSLSRPICHDAPWSGSPVAALLRQLKGFGVQLRFREDGVNTVLTLERKDATKPILGSDPSAAA